MSASSSASSGRVEAVTSSNYVTTVCTVGSPLGLNTWDKRDDQLWQTLKKGTNNDFTGVRITGRRVLDCGCGLGRLATRLLNYTSTLNNNDDNNNNDDDNGPPELLVMIEPDRQRYAHATLVVTLILRSQEAKKAPSASSSSSSSSSTSSSSSSAAAVVVDDLPLPPSFTELRSVSSIDRLLSLLDDVSFRSSSAYNELLQYAIQHPVVTKHVVVLNMFMQLRSTHTGTSEADKQQNVSEDALAAFAPFDVILSSHVFQHVAFRVVQESLLRFHALLKPHTGTLLLFTCKSAVLRHTRWGKEFDTSFEAVTTEEFADITMSYTDGQGVGGLGIRYFPFPLMQDVLHDPLNAKWRTVFGRECTDVTKSGKEKEKEEEKKSLFRVGYWEAYHLSYLFNTFVELPLLQAHLGQRFKVPEIKTAQDVFDIEAKINSFEHTKLAFCDDMLIVAHKN